MARPIIGAVDIGGTKIAVGLVQENGELLAFSLLPTHPGQSYAAGLQEVTGALEHLLHANQAALQGIGIGVTGRLHPEGRLHPNPFLPAWGGQSPAQDLAGYFNTGAAIENDADAAALAEYCWGDCAGFHRLLYITVSTGIGGGLVLDGCVYRGVLGCHPELGHMVIDPAGPSCYCGARGCWEALASGTALAAWVKQHGGQPGWDARQICDLAEAGSALARQAVERHAHYLGLGLANLVTLFAPHGLVLGGGLMQRWPLFRPIVQATLVQQCGLVPWQQVRMGASSLSHPGLQGAAAVWLQQAA